jgi:transcriptional regulator with XRE-family HTH domain
MFSITAEEAEALQALGARLRRRRLTAGDPQLRAAGRIGVSLPTYRKLEHGDPGAQVGVWVRALRLYGGLDDLDLLFPESLFDEAAPRRRVARSSG